jgi:hypothetical protein
MDIVEGIRNERRGAVALPAGDHVDEASFSIYYQFSQIDHTRPYDLDRESFILHIECATGDVYELRVWTEDYLARMRAYNRESGEHLSGQYVIPPDLIIASQDDVLIGRVVADLIQSNGLREEWLIPDIETAYYVDDPREHDKDDEEDDDEWCMVASITEEDLADYDGCHVWPGARAQD